MHHFKPFCYGWRRGYAYGVLGAKVANKSTHMESRGHRGSRGANFGVRRPLRYLAYHLDLDEAQTRAVAGILNRLKLEREQAELDNQRTVAALADLLTGEAPMDEELKVALTPRVDSAKRLRDEVAHALKSLHETLDDDQRSRLAVLMESGTLAL